LPKNEGGGYCGRCSLSTAYLSGGLLSFMSN